MDRPYESYFALLPSMKARFDEAGGRYAALRDGLRPQIARWEWAAYPRQELQPFLMSILGHPKPGRVIKSEPKSRNGKYRHGYDGQDRVILTEQYTELDGKFYETYLEYFEDRVESTRYEYGFDKECGNVETLLLDEGRPIAFLRYSQGGQDVVAYEYEEGRIVRFWQATRQHEGMPYAGRLLVQKGTVSYEGGALESLELEHFTGGRELILRDGPRRSVPRETERTPLPVASEIPSINPRAAKKQFLEAMERAGFQLETLAPAQGIALMLDLYRDERARGCSLAEDGDMLLFQWGVWNMSDEECFLIEITRQLIDTDDGADGAMRQLSLSFRFTLDDDLRSLPTSNRWCTTPDELDGFLRIHSGLPGVARGGIPRAVEVVLRFGEV